MWRNAKCVFGFVFLNRVKGRKKPPFARPAFWSLSAGWILPFNSYRKDSFLSKEISSLHFFIFQTKTTFENGERKFPWEYRKGERWIEEIERDSFFRKRVGGKGNEKSFYFLVKLEFHTFFFFGKERHLFRRCLILQKGGTTKSTWVWGNWSRVKWKERT